MLRYKKRELGICLFYNTQKWSVKTGQFFSCFKVYCRVGFTLPCSCHEQRQETHRYCTARTPYLQSFYGTLRTIYRMASCPVRQVPLSSENREWTESGQRVAVQPQPRQRGQPVEIPRREGHKEHGRQTRAVRGGKRPGRGSALFRAASFLAASTPVSNCSRGCMLNDPPC